MFIILGSNVHVVFPPSLSIFILAQSSQLVMSYVILHIIINEAKVAQPKLKILLENFLNRFLSKNPFLLSAYSKLKF